MTFLFRTATEDAEIGGTPVYAGEHIMLSMAAANRDDPQYGNAPIRELAALDPHRGRYLEQLQRLAERYHDSELHDNLVVRWASALPDVGERAAVLEGCIRRFTSGDALPEALYRLANLETQALAAEDELQQQWGHGRALGEQPAVERGHGRGGLDLDPLKSAQSLPSLEERSVPLGVVTFQATGASRFFVLMFCVAITSKNESYCLRMSFIF